MFDFDRWQIVNEEYLSSSLDWLRLRLQRMAEGESLDAFPLSGDRFGEKCVDDNEYQPALEILSARLGLSNFEKCVLLLCAAMEFDSRVPELCAAAQADPNKPFPTFSLCFAIFADGAWDTVSPERPLRQLRLVEIERQSHVPLMTSPLRADERVVNYLKGLNHLDERLAIFLAPLQIAEPRELPPSQQALAEHIVSEIQLPSNRPIIQLLGSHTDNKQLIVALVAQELGLYVHCLSADLIPHQLDELDTFVRLWHRECQMMPLALYIDAQKLATGSEQALGRLLAPVNGVVFCDCLDRLESVNSINTQAIDVAKPVATEQQQAWSGWLPESVADFVQQLTGQFDLNLSTIAHVIDATSTADHTDVADFRSRLWNSCRDNTRPKLDELAQRIDCKATWDDIVLPDEELDLLRQVAAQVRNRGKVLDEWGFRNKVNRGLGVTTLFAGESGTGKTMAAEVIANDLQLDLFRIDLSSVINKYIGETEKNLRRLFDAAEDGGAILFFDEADALFGKRSEVKDSHDRFANVQVNYLLQRMESYRGLAILATNNKQALDSAFTRRLRFIIDFRFPDVAQRNQIWRRAFPERAPLSGLDYKHLANLRLTGGNIHNIAMNAAFTAAGDRPSIDMPAILGATKTEMNKTQQTMNGSDLRWAHREAV